MKLKLKDGREIKVLDSTLPTIICMECDSVTEIEEVREMLTKENLSDFLYLDDEGKIYGEYKHYILENVSYMKQDGIYHCKYHIRQLSDTEIRLDDLEQGQETQNGAIEELASIVGGE